MKAEFLALNTVNAEQLERWESWLSAEKRQRMDRLHPQRRLQSLCGEGLARQMLAELLGIAPQDLTFTVNENGKPLVEGAFFSISHSGELVGCAVSDRPVGLDIEEIRDVPERLGRVLDGQWQTPEAFFRLWTRREAAIKCRGDRLSAWKSCGEEGLSFTSIAVPQGYVATLCEA